MIGQLAMPRPLVWRDVAIEGEAMRLDDANDERRGRYEDCYKDLRSLA